MEAIGRESAFHADPDESFRSTRILEKSSIARADDPISVVLGWLIPITRSIDGSPVFNLFGRWRLRPSPKARAGKDDVPPNCLRSGKLSELIDEGNVMCRRSQSRLNHLAYVGYDLSEAVPVYSVMRNDRTGQFREGQTNMDVSGVGSVGGTTPIRAVTPAVSQPVPSDAAIAPQDELEISSAGKMLDRLSETPEVRAERLAQIKEAIENGEYDTDEKLEAALSRMFQSLGIDATDQ
jgi:anti-sigma28 factor (negative regulator of flagellin synthesis)